MILEWKKFVKYNTDINPIGSIPDYQLIIRALLIGGENVSELERVLVEENEFDFRTEQARGRFKRVLISSFLRKYDAHLQELIQAIASLENGHNLHALLIFWILSLNNDLFREISDRVLLKNYFMGRAEMPKDDVYAFLKDLVSRNPKLKEDWSEKTIEKVASKYLTIMKKLGVLEGSQKKFFKHVPINDSELTIFLYFLMFASPNSDVLKSELLKFCFLTRDGILHRVKRIALKDWIKMKYDGVTLKLEASMEPKELVYALYNGSKSKV